MAYASWSVVFGEQPSAAKWNILGTNDAYFDAQIGTGTAWASWTPSYTNLTVGSGTVTAKYSQIGKLVFFRYALVLSSTTVGTNPTISLPVTAVTYAGTANSMPLAFGNAFDTSGSANYLISGHWATTTTITLRTWDSSTASLSRASLAVGTPMTWANGDELHLQGLYEAA